MKFSAVGHNTVFFSSTTPTLFRSSSSNITKMRFALLLLLCVIGTLMACSFAASQQVSGLAVAKDSLRF
jgi:hypothetical protein